MSPTGFVHDLINHAGIAAIIFSVLIFSLRLCSVSAMHSNSFMHLAIWQSLTNINLFQIIIALTQVYALKGISSITFWISFCLHENENLRRRRRRKDNWLSVHVSETVTAWASFGLTQTPSHLVWWICTYDVLSV